MCANMNLSEKKDKGNFPFVSIIIPVFNSEKIIRRCLESLLRQTYPTEKYEIIIVDNGSYDNSVKIIKEFPIKLFFEKRAHNSYMARNCGLRHAKGEIIAFIDADCIARKDWLQNLIEPFKDVNVGVVAGEVLNYKPMNLIQGFYAFSDFLRQETKVQKKVPAIGTANVAFRKVIFNIVGQFDENFRWGGDNDFGVRIQKETNYLIRFAKRAKVYHFHRISLKELIRHAYTYGLGKGRFLIKYSNNKRIKDIIEGFCTFFRLLAGIFILPLYSYKILKSGKSITESLAYPIFDKFFCIVDQIGKIIFLISKDDVFLRNN